MATIASGFTGVYRDPASLGYPLGSGYRWHLPSLMRFNAPDDWSPFGAGGIHPYSYCGADPINRTDWNGHMFAELDYIESIEEVSQRLDREMYEGKPPGSDESLVRFDDDATSGTSMHIATQQAAGPVVANDRPHPPQPRATPQPIAPAHPAPVPPLPQDQMELTRFYRAAVARNEITWNDNARIGEPWATWKTTPTTWDSLGNRAWKTKENAMKRLGFFHQNFTEYQMIKDVSPGNGLSMELMYESPATLPQEAQQSDSVIFPIIADKPNQTSFNQARNQRMLSWNSFID